MHRNSRTAATGIERSRHKVPDHEVPDIEVQDVEVLDQKIHSYEVLEDDVPKHDAYDHEVQESVALGREVSKHEVQDHEVPNNEVYDNEVPDHEFQDKVTPDHNVYDCEVQNCEIHSSEILGHDRHDVEVVDNKVHDYDVQDNDIDDNEGRDHDVASTDNPDTGTHSDGTPISRPITHNSRCDNVTGCSLEDADETPNEQGRSDNDNDDDKLSHIDCNDESSPGSLGDVGCPASVTEDNSASSIKESIQPYAEENTCYHQLSEDSMSTMQETALSAYDSRDQTRNEDNIPSNAQRDVTGCAQYRKASDVSHSVHDEGELNDAHAPEDINCKPYQDKDVTKDVAISALESKTEEPQQRHTSADDALEISERHNIDQDSVGQNPRNTSITSKCGETDAVNDITGSLTDDVEDCVSSGGTAETKPPPVSITSSDETARESRVQVPPNVLQKVRSKLSNSNPSS